MPLRGTTAGYTGYEETWLGGQGMEGGEVSNALCNYNYSIPKRYGNMANDSSGQVQLGNQYRGIGSTSQRDVIYWYDEDLSAAHTNEDDNTRIEKKRIYWS